MVKPILYQFPMSINFHGNEWRHEELGLDAGLHWDLKLQQGTGVEDPRSESESFEPEYHQIKRLGLKPNRKKIRTGGWSAFQNQVYLRFMLKHLQDFRSERERRRQKVFYRLSKVLRLRTPDQCRSHHQKLQLKHGDNLQAIISQIQRKIKTSFLHQMLNDQSAMVAHQCSSLGYLPSLAPVSPTPHCRHFKTIMEKEWFAIESWRGCLKISINSDSIAEW